MRIPGNTIHQSHVRTYGSGGIELFDGHEMPGCPALYKAKYVEKKTPPQLDRFELLYGTAIHEALYLVEEEGMDPHSALVQAWPAELDISRFEEAERDLRNVIEQGGVLPLLSTVAVEQHLTAPLYEDEQFGPIEMGGIIDNLAVNVEEPGVLFVADYKTDRRPPSYKMLRNWIQGRHYALLAWENRHLFSNNIERVVVLYEAVKWRTLPIEYTREELESYRAWLEAVARKILRDKHGLPVLNPSCSWCPIRMECPAFQSLPVLGDTILEKVLGKDLPEMVAMMDEAKAVKSKLDSMIKDVKQAIEVKVERDGPQVYGREEYYLDEGRSKNPDPKRLHEIMGDEFYDVISVRIGDTEKWAEDHLDVAPEIERMLEPSPNGKTYLKTRRAEKDDEDE